MIVPSPNPYIIYPTGKPACPAADGLTATRLIPRRLVAGRRMPARRLAAVCVTAVVLGMPLTAAHGQSVPTSAVTPQPTSSVDDASRIAIGDKIIMRVWREPTWSDAFSIDLAGNLSLPRIGRLHAVGLTPAALGDTIRARLAVYLREPNVDVVLLRRVAVLGAVKKPDVLYVESFTTLRDILAQAGGLSEDGDPNRIEVLRGGQRVRLGRWSEIAETSALVQSGDQLVVGRRSWISRNALTAVSSLAVAVSVLISAFRR